MILAKFEGQREQVNDDSQAVGGGGVNPYARERWRGTWSL